MPIEDDPGLRDLLERTRTIAVLGAKAGAHEDAFRVPDYMRRAGHRVQAVNPKLAGQGDPPGVARLAEAEPADLIDVFRASEHLAGHVEEILALPWRPLGVWLQLGIRDPAATGRLEQAGIVLVEDRCLMVEHARLLPERRPARDP